MKTVNPKSVVFITGSFLSSNCWNEWLHIFEKRGYHCIAPAWPFKYADPAELRKYPVNSNIASNRLHTLVEYFAAILISLPAKPIIVGHSLGGLIVQLLLQRGLGSAGVAVHSLPSMKIQRELFCLFIGWWRFMGFFTSVQKTYLMSFEVWQDTIANTLVCKKQKEFYCKYLVPESKLVIRDVFRSGNTIDFKKRHAPLLFTSGGNDNIIPASCNCQNYKNYKDVESITEYKHFRFHNHLVFDSPSSHEEANYVLDWLRRVE